MGSPMQLPPGSTETRALLAAAGLQAALELGACADAAVALQQRWLPAARVLSLDDAELYFLEPEDAVQFATQLSPRNEAAALALLLDTLRDDAGTAALAAVRAHCDALPCSAAAAAATAGDTSPAAAAWAAQRGVRSRLRAACFDGVRGAAAAEAVRAGECVVELPAAALVTPRCAHEAPGLGDALRRVAGVDDDTAALLWTMRERADASSAYAPLWASLPSAPLHTGLTLPAAALATLEGTLLHEEVQRLQAAARAQHAALFPVLSDAFPDVFTPASAFTFDAYCIAAEIWQAYAVRVLPPGADEPVSALLPEALLMNHSVHAHVVRFSAPDADGVLRLRALRRCGAGKQLFMSYGALPNAQLIAFYGFTTPDNPYDVVPLAFELPDAEEEEEEGAAALRAAVLSRWQLGLEHSLRRGGRLPTRLLGALRVLTASAAELAGCAADPRAVPLSAANEGTVLATLAQTLDALLQALPPPPQPQPGEPHAQALAHCATYLRGQRDILLHAQQQCAALQAALDAVDA